MKSLKLIFTFVILSELFLTPLFAQQVSKDFYLRGALYFDWYGSSLQDTDFYHQLSSRFKLDLINRRGSGWNLLLDLRDRVRLSEPGSNHVLLYNARINYEQPHQPWYFSFGQMNLYDTAGIGQLLGGVLGFKPTQGVLLGGYVGLESSVYVRRIERDYQKFGAFLRYLGKQGKRLSLSFNQLQYDGQIERQYLYTSGLFPVQRLMVFYGSMEYELANHVRSSDRLSRLFLNLRLDPIQAIDLIAFYSSGRGLDFHRYVIEASQNPSLNNRELARYYYSLQYGLRLSYKPTSHLRFFIARQESENKDDNIRNHTWRFGASVHNLFRLGITAYGNYAANRGEISESDSFYVSLTKDFERFSWNVSYSNTFNGIRYNHSSDSPELIHLNDYKAITTNIFFSINRFIATSVEYEYFIQREANQHLFFVRLILRK